MANALVRSVGSVGTGYQRAGIQWLYLGRALHRHPAACLAINEHHYEVVARRCKSRLQPPWIGQQDVSVTPSVNHANVKI